jgi:hypothetical protein
MKPAR